MNIAAVYRHRLSITHILTKAIQVTNTQLIRARAFEDGIPDPRSFSRGHRYSGTIVFEKLNPMQVRSLVTAFNGFNTHVIWFKHHRITLGNIIAISVFPSMHNENSVHVVEFGANDLATDYY